MSAYAFVVTWVLQSTILGVVALSLPSMFRMRDRRALRWWWTWAAYCSVWMPLLPMLRPEWAPSPMPLTTLVETTTAALVPVLATAPALSPMAWLCGVWAAGALLRLTWLVVGQQRLRRLAARGVVVENDPALDRARALAPAAPLPPLAPARVPVVAVAAAGPCAFGWVNACVLVPVALNERPDEERLAVYLHELAHIARLDVSRAYADESWRLLWWWQPTVWFLLARGRLAREHEVDALVVSRTGAMRAYVDALLWCSTLQPAQSPGMPVGSGRHALVRRVALMCEGATMSRTRRWITAAAMMLIFSGVWGVVSTYSPLRASQLAADGVGTVEAGPLERVAVRPTLDLPAPRRTLHVAPNWPADAGAARYRVHLVLDASGQVAEARVITGAAAAERDNAVPAEIQAVLAAVRQWTFEPPAKAPMLIATEVGSRDEGARGTIVSTPRALRAGGTIAPPRKIYDVKAEYPEAAKNAGITGVVTIETTVGVDGTVTDAHVSRGVAELDDAAVAAVRQWRFEPVLLNGEPVPVMVEILVNFTLK
jgi:protein TonB